MPDLIRAFIAVTLPEPLAGLVSEVQQKLKALGLRIAWVPPGNVHLTLGRIKARMNSGILVKALRETGRVDFPAFAVDAVHLIQSRLTSTGSIYTPLRRVVLGSPACGLFQKNAIAHK